MNSLNERIRSFWIGLGLSLGAIWFLFGPLAIGVDHFSDRKVAQSVANSGVPTFDTLQFHDVVFVAAITSVLMVMHWYLAALFSKGAFHKAWLANGAVGLCIALAFLATLNIALQDYWEFSIICGANEPVYVEFDVVFQCLRAWWFEQVVFWLVPVLAFVAVPIRILRPERLIGSRS
jgi:hypothetical protein